jgi:hypothetical protein
MLHNLFVNEVFMSTSAVFLSDGEKNWWCFVAKMWQV